MPAYIYQHPQTDELIEIIQSANEDHIYIDADGIQWNRVFTPPQISIDSQNKCESSSSDFISSTKNKKYNIGDMWDKSLELSEKRKRIYGKDPVKEKYFKDWSKKRKGKVHPKQNSE